MWRKSFPYLPEQSNLMNRRKIEMSEEGDAVFSARTAAIFRILFLLLIVLADHGLSLVLLKNRYKIDLFQSFLISRVD